jgi:hypothetical protein
MGLTLYRPIGTNKQSPAGFVDKGVQPVVNHWPSIVLLAAVLDRWSLVINSLVVVVPNEVSMFVSVGH